MRGFKSFGNSKVTLPLAPGLTAIIGPNGHGKSNIVEAFRFVLGDMSAKTMRAERFSDMLFNGGKGGRPASMAEVSLHFDNTDRAFPVDSNVLTITRIVNRSGNCVYKINKKHASRQEVIDLLAPVISSLGGYNFIMQGDVERFIKMDPIDRRKIIDDLAGVAEYDEKREKALGQLRQVETNLETLGATLNEIKTQMEKLRDERDHALRHRELDAKIKQYRAMLLQIQRDTFEKKLADTRDGIQTCTKQKQELVEKLNQVEEEVKNHDRKVRELNKFIEQSQSSGAMAIASGLRERISVLTELASEAKRDYERIEKDLNDTQKELEKIGALTDKEPIEEFARLSSEFDRFRQEFNNLLQDFNNAKSSAKVNELLEKLRSVLNEIDNTVSGLSTCVKQIIESPKETGKTKISAHHLRTRLATLNGQRQQLEHRLKEYQQKISATQKSLESVTQQESELLKSIQNARKERHQLESKIKNLKGKADHLGEEIEALEDKVQGYQIEEAKIQVQLANIEKELQHFRVRVKVQPGVNQTKLEEDISKLEAEINALGPINARAVRDFRNVERRYNAQNAQFNKLTNEKQTILDLIANIDKKKEEIFMRTFDQISKNFSETFSELSPGGTAKFILENPEHPLEGGLVIEAKPAGKKVFSRAMSGGERALTALAFIFAIQRTKPTALYILDEIDAHLDPENRQRVAQLLHRSSKQSQIILVTLHDAMMAVADRLFGVSMDESGVSHLLAVELSGYAA
jgi:chromosome segregation ATPase